MADTTGNTLSWFGRAKPAQAQAAETSSGGTRPTRWVVVAENLNPGEAVVIKGRLESEDIPAVVQQEAFGAFIGLTVGALGSAKVSVPEPLADRALAILAETFEAGDDPDDFPDLG
jgi:hypothetical protein